MSSYEELVAYIGYLEYNVKQLTVDNQNLRDAISKLYLPSPRPKCATEQCNNQVDIHKNQRQYYKYCQYCAKSRQIIK